MVKKRPEIPWGSAALVPSQANAKAPDAAPATAGEETEQVNVVQTLTLILGPSGRVPAQADVETNETSKKASVDSRRASFLGIGKNLTPLVDACAYDSNLESVAGVPSQAGFFSQARRV